MGLVAWCATTPVLEEERSRAAAGFSHEVQRRTGAVASLEEINHWQDLASNIWNNTPQPDRGGKSANELIQESGGPPDLEIQMGPL